MKAPMKSLPDEPVINTLPGKAYTIRFVSTLPELIHPNDETDSNGCKKIRIRIQQTDEGVEILSDCEYDSILKQLLAQLGVKEVEMSLCG